jgi:hypothetical protein
MKKTLLRLDDGLTLMRDAPARVPRFRGGDGYSALSLRKATARLHAKVASSWL